MVIKKRWRAGRPLEWLAAFACRWMNVNESAFGPDWSKIAILNQVNWGDWVLTEMPDPVKSTFSGRNWDYFNPEEQIVVKDDVAYIVLY